MNIHITSFSYKLGYPSDVTGHGGGFVFDCRIIPNPGREERYKKKNGRDEDVVEFLKAQPSAERLWDDASDIVTVAIDNYLERGFTELSVGFGCTGGQHRSVYFAERLAAMVKQKYPDVNVVLTHREREMWVR